MKSFLVVLIVSCLISMVFSGKTVSNPSYYQLDGTSDSTTVKYTPYDLSPDTTIADIIVTISWYRSSGNTCFSPTSSANFDQTAFLLQLLDRNNNAVAGENLYPAAGYSSTYSQATPSLIVQSFITSPASYFAAFSPFPNDNYINDFNNPSSGFLVPVNGFQSFIGHTLNNQTFFLTMVDIGAPDNNYLCFSQLEVTVNCRSRSVIYKPTLTVNQIDLTSYSLASNPIQFQTQQYTPLQSTLTFVSVTLAWTKSAIQFGTCNPLTAASGQGDRYLQYLSASLTYTPTSGSAVTVVLVQPGTWSSQSALATQGNYFSTTFDSTSVNRYPNTLLGGRYQPYQSLSLFNGLSPWGTWTLTVQDTDSGYPTCIFGARIALATCTDNPSCLCTNAAAGSPALGVGASQNQVGSITSSALLP